MSPKMYRKLSTLNWMPRAVSASVATAKFTSLIRGTTALSSLTPRAYRCSHSAVSAVRSEQFRHPTDLVVDARGNVYIVDSGNNRIKKYDFSGNLSATWGEGQFREPSHIARDRWNYLYVTDRGARNVQLFTLDGKALMAFGDETLLEPTGIAISRDGRIFITDFGANNIKVFEVIYRPNP